MPIQEQIREKRKTKRYEVAYPVSVELEDKRIMGHIANMSEGGLGLIFEQDIDLNKPMALHIDFSPRQPEVEVTVRAKWKRQVKLDKHMRLGVQYVNLPVKTDLIIKRILTDLSDKNNGQKANQIPRDDLTVNQDSNALKKVTWLAQRTHQSFQHIPQYSFDAQHAKSHVENLIGSCQIPLGLAGPMLVNGTHARGEYYVPMATTEGTLVETYHYGMFVANKCGGINVTLLNDQMDITPVFYVKDISESKVLCEWLESHFDEVKAAAEQTTKHGLIRSIRTRIVGRRVYAQFFLTTGDAMGLNIANIAVQEACRHVMQKFPVEKYYLRSNLSTDKKPAFSSLDKTYGKELVADLTIPRRYIKRFYGVEPVEVYDFYASAQLGCTQAGMIGYNAHFANGLAAIFAACGQDLAQVVNASIGLLHMEVLEDGDLYFNIKTPNIIVGTVGGGTDMDTQRECLNIMGCYGAGKVQKFAEIIAATLLAGELSICAALASGKFVDAHVNKRKLNQK